MKLRKSYMHLDLTNRWNLLKRYKKPTLSMRIYRIMKMRLCFNIEPGICTSPLWNNGSIYLTACLLKMTNILDSITIVGLMAERWGSQYKYHKKDNHFELLSLL